MVLSFDQPRKDERLSQSWIGRPLGSLDCESSTLTSHLNVRGTKDFGVDYLAV